MPHALLTAYYNQKTSEYSSIYLDDPSGIITAQLRRSDFKEQKPGLSARKLCISPMQVLNIAEECGFELKSAPPRPGDYHILYSYSWQLHKPVEKS
ncbi:unnamed protein product, partial [Mesorhabditis spiculigera]